MNSTKQMIGNRRIKTKPQAANTRLVHWLADVHFAGFAPAFTLSFHDSERSSRQGRDQMPIGSVDRAF